MQMPAFESDSGGGEKHLNLNKWRESCQVAAVWLCLWNLNWAGKTSAVDQATAGQNELRSVTFFPRVRSEQRAQPPPHHRRAHIQSASGSPHGWADERRLFLTLLVTWALDQSH